MSQPPLVLIGMVLRLLSSANWKTIDTTTLTFPGEMLVKYAHIYQRKGHTNLGYDPKDYSAMDYIIGIKLHIQVIIFFHAFVRMILIFNLADANLTTSTDPKLKNGPVSLLTISLLSMHVLIQFSCQYEGGC